MNSKTPMLYLRSLLFLIIFYLSVFIFTLLALFLAWLPTKACDYFLSLWPKWVTGLAKHLCGIQYTIEGLSTLPPPPFILASNHQSTWETLAFFTLFRAPCFVLKKELLSIPLFGWVVRLLHPIALDRNKKMNAVEQLMAQGKANLSQGKVVIIFPEGKRMPVGHYGHFHSGAAALAKAANVPLVPLHHNAGQFWPKKGWLKYPGTIHVHIAAPILPDESTQVIQAKLKKALTDKS